MFYLVFYIIPAQSGCFNLCFIATAGGDLGEITLVTRQLLCIVKDFEDKQASPTPAEAAQLGRKPPPNRKARK